MKFWKLVLTWTSKNPNLAEKSTSLAENLFFKVELRGVHGVGFSKSASSSSSPYFGTCLLSLFVGLVVSHNQDSYFMVVSLKKKVELFLAGQKDGQIVKKNDIKK